MDEVAKDPVLDMRERGNLNEITVAPGRQLDGHYTFMTEHVCPVGALTTVDFRFKARVWFLRSAKSICQGCATGCNAWLDYDPRSNATQRYRPRDNEAVNKFWMCDEGMLTYKRAHDDRILEPLVSGRVTSEASAIETVKKLFEGVSKSGIGIVFSAQRSLEDNWALSQFATILLGTGNLFVSGAPDGYEDAILIHKDKNSNTAGVKELVPAAKPFSALVEDIASGRVTHVIALGSAMPQVDEKTQSHISATLKMPRALVVIAAHEGPLVDVAHVVLPACSWAEASGTYVNAKGLRQASDKAIEPLGKSRPAWEQVARVARALGFDAGWTRLKDIRAKVLATDGEPAARQAASSGVAATPHTTESV
jgi:NADH-quinone oxidoreductase subunit G